MQGTRERILAEVISTRGVRVEELAETLDISAAAVRRHLDNLRADGLIDSRGVKQATGRPYHEYFPTEGALGALPEGYARLLEHLLPAIEHDETVAQALSNLVAHDVAKRHAGEVTGESAEEAVAQVTASLREEGILEHWHETDEGYHLVNGTCPYLHAAELSRLPCESDRQAIALLIGSDVEQIQRIVDGAPTCDYLLRHRERDAEREQLSMGKGVS